MKRRKREKSSLKRSDREKSEILFESTKIAILAGLMTYFLVYLYQNSIDVDLYTRTDHESKFNGMINDLRSNRGFSCITLEDQSKYLISDARNDNYEPNHFYAFVREGDFIAKLEKSDSIILVRGGKQYYFRLNERIRKDND